MASFNFVESYLRAIFGFVGLTDIHVFHANGMDMGPDIKKAGQRSAIAQAREFVQSGVWRPAALPVGALAAPDLVGAAAALVA
jgi:FMN-dependent NADH-azoreductase